MNNTGPFIELVLQLISQYRNKKLDQLLSCELGRGDNFGIANCDYIKEGMITSDANRMALRSMALLWSVSTPNPIRTGAAQGASGDCQ